MHPKIFDTSEWDEVVRCERVNRFREWIDRPPTPANEPILSTTSAEQLVTARIALMRKDAELSAHVDLCALVRDVMDVLTPREVSIVWDQPASMCSLPLDAALLARMSEVYAPIGTNDPHLAPGAVRVWGISEWADGPWTVSPAGLDAVSTLNDILNEMGHRTHVAIRLGWS